MGTSSMHRGVRNCRTTAALLYEGTVLSMAGLLLQSGLVLGLRQNSLQIRTRTWPRWVGFDQFIITQLLSGA
jgi:hypothetical protein